MQRFLETRKLILESICLKYTKKKQLLFWPQRRGWFRFVTKWRQFVIVDYFLITRFWTWKVVFFRLEPDRKKDNDNVRSVRLFIHLSRLFFLTTIVRDGKEGWLYVKVQDRWKGGEEEKGMNTLWRLFDNDKWYGNQLLGCSWQRGGKLGKKDLSRTSYLYTYYLSNTGERRSRF